MTNTTILNKRHVLLYMMFSVTIAVGMAAVVKYIYKQGSIEGAALERREIKRECDTYPHRLYYADQKYYCRKIKSK